MEYFDLINELSTINKSIIFNREEDKISVKRKDQEKSIAYTLVCDKECFDIDESIGFYDFVEFYRFLKAIDSPEIKKGDNRFILTKENSKLNYLFSNIEAIDEGPKEIKFPDYDYKFLLTKDALYELVKMHNNIKSKVASLSHKDGIITVKFFKDEFDNSFVKTFDAEVKNNEEFDFSINSDLFEKLPKRDYTVYIKNPGYIKIKLNHETFDLNIYTSRLKD
jgi:hypothetical protein